MTKTIFLLAQPFLATVAAAQALPSDVAPETIIVTGVRALDGQDEALSGASITRLDEAALESRQTRVVADVLRDVPGLAVSRSGGLGAATAVRIRGGEGNHTLVLIDGIEASDPFQGEFDFATLIADDKARLEVLRGQSSSIYGSDAIGGVVHYITPSGRERAGASGRLEAGSFGTVNGAARLGGASGAFDYAVSGGFLDSEGTPTARAGIGDRDLRASTGALSTKLGLDVAPNLRVSAVGRFGRTFAETNPQDFDFTSPTYGFVIDGDGAYRARQLLGLVRAELSLLDGRWSHAATAQVNNAHRENLSADTATFATRGQRWKAAYDTTFRIDGGRVDHALTFAADFERETFRNVALSVPTPANLERATDNTGIVGEYRIALAEIASVTGSIRHDFNNRFEDATTYRVQGAVQVAGPIRLRAATGSGVKNPTNFELFGFDPRSFIGNPDLRPEKSTGWEAGADLTLGAWGTIGGTYFRSVLRDEIFTRFSPSFVSTPDNRATRSRQQGVEAFASVRPLEALRLDLSYTYLDAEENGVEEIRRAPHIGSANIEWRQPGAGWGANLNVRVNGAQLDSNFTNLPLGPRVRLDSFVLLGFAADVALAEGVQLFGRVENILDEDYEEVFTYRAPGRAAFAGVRVGF